MLIKSEQIYFDFDGQNIVVHKVKNMEELITDPTDPDKVPCWAEIWPASIGLARYIHAQRDLTHITAIELGAGLGLPGVLAGQKGAHITFSDFNAQALYYCDQNARSNGLQKYDTLLADWRDFPPDLKYDLVLGSDIVYEPRLLPYLEKVLADFLNGNCEVLLSHSSRIVSFEFAEELAHNLQKEHYLDYIDVSVEESLFTDYRIAIHSIK